MKRKFISNLALLIFLNLLIKPFWVFGIDRKVQNLVGSEEYGFYFSLFSFSVLLNILLDGGITNLNNRSISRNHALLPLYLSRMVPVRFMLASVYMAITLIAGFFIGYSVEQLKLLMVLIINQFILSFILYLRSNISGLQLFKSDSIVSVLDRFLMIIICAVLIWGNIFNQPFRIEWFVYAQTISYLLTAVCASIIVISNAGNFRFQFNLNFTRKILTRSFPYALLILLMSLFNRLDMVFLERMLPDGKVQAGIYAQSFRILDAATMFAFLFTGLLLPIFSRMIKKKEPLADLIRLSYALLIVPAISIILVSTTFAHPIISALYNHHSDYSSGIFSVLIISFFFISTTCIFGPLLTANGNLKELNILAGITVLLNVTLNIVLIPEYKAMGTAISNLVSQGVFAIGLILLSKNIFNLRINYKLIFQLLIFTFLVAASTRLLEAQVESKATGFMLSFSLALILSWLLQIIKPQAIINILNTR